MTVAMEVFIRQLLYYSLCRLRELIEDLGFSEEKAHFLADQVRVDEANED